jgi:hypothetical protein
MEKVAHYYKDKTNHRMHNGYEYFIIGWCGRSSKSLDYSYDKEFWTKNVKDVNCIKCKEEVGLHLLSEVG